MKTGIVILNYNTADLTRDLAERCLAMPCIDEVVVVDNASPDGSGEQLKETLPAGVVFIQSQENAGYARGNNLGLKKLGELGCEICLVANPDVRFDEKTILALQAAFAVHPEYGVLTTARRMENPEIPIRQYWDLPTKEEVILENFTLWLRRFKKMKWICRAKETELFTIEVAPGAFFGIRSSFLEKIGYLDENTFLYFEENILAMKVKESGSLVGFLPEVEYICLERKKSSSRTIQQSAAIRKFYVRSKEYFAKSYLKMNPLEMGILKLTDRLFILEKQIYVLLGRGRA